MKKTLKRIGTAFMAAALAAALAVPAFAANTNDATTNTYKGIESTDNTIGIAKQIVFINAEETTVREPNITYTYTISAVNPEGATVKDHDSIKATVKQGVIGAVTGAKTATTSEVEFTDTSTAAAKSDGTGTADIKYANFTFTPATFSAPGIYRYKISETSNVTKASVGIAEAATYGSDRYLDVYVSKTSSTDETLKIYGYVLYEDSASTSFDASEDPTVNIDKKSAGYVNKATTAGEQADVDVYTTQNLYVNKTTTGTMADKNQFFTLTYTMGTPGGVTATTKLDATVTNATLTGIQTADTVGQYINLGSITTATVKDGGVITIKGIPVGTSAATVKLTEKNDSPDAYKVKAGTEAAGADLLTEAIVYSGATSGETTSQTLSNTVKVYFTNTLEAISPTGVVLRFAPYVLMLVAGLAIFFVGRKFKKENED